MKDKLNAPNGFAKDILVFPVVVVELQLGSTPNWATESSASSTIRPITSGYDRGRHRRCARRLARTIPRFIASIRGHPIEDERRPMRGLHQSWP